MVQNSVDINSAIVLTQPGMSGVKESANEGILNTVGAGVQISSSRINLSGICIIFYHNVCTCTYSLVPRSSSQLFNVAC